MKCVLTGIRPILVVLLLLGASNGAIATEGKGMLLTREGLGPIRLGMTLAELKKVFPKVRFKRCEDGDGLLLVCMGKPYQAITLFADEDDRDKPINWQARIEYIETFRPQDYTASGLHVGMLIRTAEKRLGPILEIGLSDIEQRQYLRLAGQPDWLTIRIDYTGIFAAEQNVSRRYQANGRLFSLSTSD